MTQTTPFTALGLENDVIETLKTIFDPEIPVNIYDLGLIYDVEVTPEANITIRMTLTSPACPVAQSLPADVEWKVRSVPSVKEVTVEVVWDPPWTPERMTEEARLELGLW
jgi:FeS assembly SUF system protein